MASSAPDRRRLEEKRGAPQTRTELFDHSLRGGPSASDERRPPKVVPRTSTVQARQHVADGRRRDTDGPVRRRTPHRTRVRPPRAVPRLGRSAQSASPGERDRRLRHGACTTRAGFVIGAGLLGLVFAASRLDGVIADAQVRGFERDKDERWKKTKSVEGGGNIFILPDDEDE